MKKIQPSPYPGGTWISCTGPTKAELRQEYKLPNEEPYAPYSIVRALPSTKNYSILQKAQTVSRENSFALKSAGEWRRVCSCHRPQQEPSSTPGYDHTATSGNKPVLANPARPSVSGQKSIDPALNISILTKNVEAAATPMDSFPVREPENNK